MNCVNGLVVKCVAVVPVAIGIVIVIANITHITIGIGWTDIWTVGLMDGWTNGWMDGWVDGWTEG